MLATTTTVQNAAVPSSLEGSSAILNNLHVLLMSWIDATVNVLLDLPEIVLPALAAHPIVLPISSSTAGWFAPNAADVDAKYC